MDSSDSAQKALQNLNNKSLLNDDSTKMNVYFSSLKKIVFQENNSGGVGTNNLQHSALKNSGRRTFTSPPDKDSPLPAQHSAFFFLDGKLVRAEPHESIFYGAFFHDFFHVHLIILTDVLSIKL